jgi:hypothetical protein
VVADADDHDEDMDDSESEGGFMSDISASESPGRKKQQKKKKKGDQPKKGDSSDKDSDKLTLGHLLTMLDGGSETPGRFVIITTNQEEKLDAAFKRPGRLKSIRLDHLGFCEFKKMILYFHNPPGKTSGSLTANGSLPTSELWTAPIEALAHVVMGDFKLMQSMRKDDLDKRGLGLSPAMLESICIEAETIQDLFELLVKEIMSQWGKAFLGAESEPPTPGVANFRHWDWKLHSLRIAVLWHLREQAESRREVVTQWPEPSLDDFSVGNSSFSAAQFLRSGEAFFIDAACEEGPSTGSRNPQAFARALLNDEARLNEALESCRFLPESTCFQDLSYRSEIWMGAGLFKKSKPPPAAAQSSPKEPRPCLASAMKIVVDELSTKWALAFSTGEIDITEHLGSSTPPSCILFGENFEAYAKAQPGEIPFSSV